ncbi:DgyrCDS4593 [Dimorphilus gyrociliatus]|uniref:DgyrCDS4593 n=1 Tax=Dimorphilus gyrociliatus TaxID=2664684 RepID=A0A7I8VH39_9ANNE|nr:DgyrCDS4593 [Dimorphilus gyrociliatus]
MLSDDGDKLATLLGLEYHHLKNIKKIRNHEDGRRSLLAEKSEQFFTSEEFLMELEKALKKAELMHIIRAINNINSKEKESKAIAIVSENVTDSKFYILFCGFPKTSEVFDELSSGNIVNANIGYLKFFWQRNSMTDVEKIEKIKEALKDIKRFDMIRQIEKNSPVTQTTFPK